MILKKIWDEILYGKFSSESFWKVHLQEVILKKLSLHVGEMPHQIIHGFSVDLHQLQRNIVSLKKILGKDTHARTDFKYITGMLKSGDDIFGNGLISEKMLTEGFFCTNFHKNSIVAQR